MCEATVTRKPLSTTIHDTTETIRVAARVTPFCECVHVSLAQKRSVILADEMGLGKTAQTVCMLEHLRGMEHVRGPFLIIVPLSTVEHWKREIEDWTTCVHVVGALPVVLRVPTVCASRTLLQFVCTLSDVCTISLPPPPLCLQHERGAVPRW